MHDRTLATILVNLFTGVIDVTFSVDIIKCAVMTCDHFAFLHCAFCNHSYCFEHFIVKISALRVANTMASAVTSRADKRHSPAHSEAHNGPVTKISYIYVCSNPNTSLVSHEINGIKNGVYPSSELHM